MADLALHVVNLAQTVHVLGYFFPRNVLVCFIAYELGGNHECGYEQFVAGGTSRRGIPPFESLEKCERGVHNSVVVVCAANCVGDEEGQERPRLGGSRGVRWTCEEVDDKLPAQFRYPSFSEKRVSVMMLRARQYVERVAGDILTICRAAWWWYIRTGFVLMVRLDRFVICLVLGIVLGQA